MAKERTGPARVPRDGYLGGACGGFGVARVLLAASLLRLGAARVLAAVGKLNYGWAQSATPPARLSRRRKMAKGQKKSNKEVRKPKAEKPKPAASGGFSKGKLA